MDDFIKVPRLFLTMAGYWPYPKRWWTIPYKLYLILSTYLISYTYIVTLTVDIYLNLTDFNVLIEAFYYFITIFAYGVKFLFFTCNWSKFVKLLQTPREEIFRCKRPEHEEFNKSWSKLSTTYGSVFYAMCFSCLLFYGLGPVISTSKDPILPLRGWFPYDEMKPGFNYYFTFVYQLVGLGIAIAVNAAIDLIPSIYMNIGTAQIEMLKDNLANAVIRAEKSIGEKNQSNENVKEIIKKNSMVIGNNYFEMLSQEADEEVYKTLVQCVHHHKAIVQLILDANQVFSWTLFTQFCTSCFSLCITALQMVIIPQNFDAQFLSVLTYLMAISIQISCFCWNGHQLIVQSSEIGLSLYNMDWYRCSTKVRRTIIIITERCKRPITFTAGNFFVLSIGTFVAVLRSSYSYFAVLRTVYKKDD